MTRLMGVGLTLLVAGLAAATPVILSVGPSHPRGREEAVRPRGDKLRGGKASATSRPRHLRAVASQADPRRAESEATVLSRVAAALDEAIDHPSLSSGWLAAFLSARAQLDRAQLEQSAAELLRE